MGWYQLAGQWAYVAGASGTVTVPKGAQVISIVAHSTAGGTVAIFGGNNIPIIAAAAPTSIFFRHTKVVAQDNTKVAASQNIVFTGTDSYFVEYVTAGNS